MRLDDILRTINYIGGQERTGLFLSIEAFNQVAKIGNSTLFDKYINQFEKNKIISEALSPFKVVMDGNNGQYFSIDEYGRGVLPSDFTSVVSLQYNYNTQDGCVISTTPTPIEQLRDVEVAVRQSDLIKMPTKKHPVCVLRDGYIQFYPIDLKYAQLVYLRMPNDVFFGYTYSDSLDMNIYDEDKSVELEWDDKYHTEFIQIILQYMGLNVPNDRILQYSLNREQLSEIKLQNK